MDGLFKYELSYSLNNNIHIGKLLFNILIIALNEGYTIYNLLTIDF